MYELIERIAVGGMAEIYLAREAGSTGIDDYLVVKRILPHFAADRQLVEMFLDEQRVAATLTHRNIVRTYDVGEVDGEFFISMEYLRGEDVRRIFRLLKKQRQIMPLHLALAIIVGAARGLHYAHEKKGVNLKPLNIVHRDVTPHNIFVLYNGCVKLLDFGVAKAANRMIQTASGTIKGKIPYMSPEQCKGQLLDRRTDIYALGVTLYELTCGVRLYHASGVEFETMRRIVEDPTIPPTMRRPDYPKELERIVLQALSKQPHDRQQTARQFADEVEAFAHAQGLDISSKSLATFMHNLFRQEITALRNAGEDITKIADQIVAKQLEVQREVELSIDSDSDGKFNQPPGLAEIEPSSIIDDVPLSEAHPWDQKTTTSHQHMEADAAVAAGSNTMQSVWGAASGSGGIVNALKEQRSNSTTADADHYRRLSASLTAVRAADGWEESATPAVADKRSSAIHSVRTSNPHIPVTTRPRRAVQRRIATPPTPIQQQQAPGRHHRPTWQWLALIIVAAIIAFCIGIAL